MHSGSRRGAIRPRWPTEMARAIRERGGKFPGFGHPVHQPLDPRAERILELADERGVSGDHVAARRAFRGAVHEAWGKPLTLNVSMPIAAVLLDLGFPSSIVKAVPLLARTASLLGHLAEEQEEPIGFTMAGPPTSWSTTSRYARARTRVGRAARARRRVLSCAARLSARALAFYRDKLAADRLADASGGSTTSHGCR